MTHLRSFTGRTLTRPPRGGGRAALVAAALVALTGCGDASSGTRSGSAQAPVPADVVYVLDGNALAESSSVFVVDVATGEVVRDYAAGRDPAMALSPDGQRLFLASRWGDDLAATDRLDVIDTATGEVLHSVSLADRWANTLPAYFPTIETSRDGRWVYVLQARTLGPDEAAFSIATIDGHTGRVLPEKAVTPGCGAASIHAIGLSRRVDLVCHLAHEARFVTMSERGAAAASDEVRLPKRDDDEPGTPNQDLALWRLSGSVAAPDGRSIYAATQNGHVSVIDAASRRLRETVDLELADHEHVPFSAVALSPGGERLYLGLGHTDDGFSRLSADEILAVDTSTWERVGVMTPSRSFESVTVGPSGEYLYAVDTESASLLVLDARTGEELRVITGVGNTPTLAEVAATS